MKKKESIPQQACLARSGAAAMANQTRGRSQSWGGGPRKMRSAREHIREAAS